MFHLHMVPGLQNLCTYVFSCFCEIEQSLHMWLLLNMLQFNVSVNCIICKIMILVLTDT